MKGEWIEITGQTGGKRRFRWQEIPAPPCTRVEFYGWLTGFFGPEDEFRQWKAEPFWRRFLGKTEWDRRTGFAFARDGGLL